MSASPMSGVVDKTATKPPVNNFRQQAAIDRLSKPRKKQDVSRSTDMKNSSKPMSRKSSHDKNGHSSA